MRKPKVAQLPVTFQANKDHVVAIFHIDANSTIGIRFQSPEEMLIFFTEMMQKAVKVWPDSQWIKEYLSD